MSANAIILTPLSVTDGMIAAGTTIAAVDATQGEAAWAAGTAYAVGQRVNHAGAIWEAVAASTGATPARRRTNGCATAPATAWRRLMTSSPPAPSPPAA